MFKTINGKLLVSVIIMFAAEEVAHLASELVKTVNVFKIH